MGERARFAFTEHLQESHHRGERRPQLVRDRGDELVLEPVHIDEVMRDAIESSAAVARGREVAVVAELEPGPAVPADRERLLQLFGNLLSNAFKFTPAGGTVTARTFTENGLAIAEVSDTGIGIPQDEQEQLFQRFFRSSTATAQAIPGTGLGLVISQAIAAAHGGVITVTSEHGEGARFRVELPLETSIVTE